LVDTLHGLTLFFIMAVIACTAYSLRLIKRTEIAKVHKFDMIAAQTLLVLYLVLNIYFIARSNGG